MGGLGPVSAVAQAPTFSAPGLPPIPGLPSLPGASAPAIPASPGIVSPPALDTDRLPNPTNPELSDLTAAPVPLASLNGKAPSNAGGALADLPAPAAPESSDVVGAAKPTPVAPESGDTTAVIVPVTPGAPEPDTDASEAPPFPMAGGLPMPPQGITTIETVLPATALPDIDVASAAPAHKSWQTRLSPTSKAYSTKFNYRRVQLPGSIFQAQYDRENRHLPTRITREDYVNLLFENAARNNIDGTRALINAGADMNALNARGETPLSVARRFGALDTAALLQARGAR